jgi:hypothetical protein
MGLACIFMGTSSPLADPEDGLTSSDIDVLMRDAHPLLAG